MKKILILGAGLEQTIAINEAKQLGYHVTACDANPHAPGFQYSDTHENVDILDEKIVLQVARNNSVNGIFAHAVEIPQVVSRVSEQMNLPCLPVDVALRATNKEVRILILKENGIPCADFISVESELELENAAFKLGFPLVIKPTDNAGSRGVRIVDDFSALGEAYNEAIKFSRSGNVLLEELLSGPEISTESVVYDGNIHTFAFADRNYARPELFSPYFIEDGINYPSDLPKDTQKKVVDLVEKTIRVLGINFGAAKGDIIIHNGVPKVIEMASRTSGGWFGAGSIPAATGINMLKPLLQMSVGDEPDLDCLIPVKNLGCAQRYIIPTGSGILRAVDGVDEAQSMPGVVMSTMFFPEIGSIIKKATNHAERFGQIICTAGCRDEAIRLCENAIGKIRLQLDE